MTTPRRELWFFDGEERLNRPSSLFCLTNSQGVERVYIAPLVKTTGRHLAKPI